MTSTSARVTPWESQGCEICRRQWETSERPPRVAENAADHSALHQCAVCRTYWLLTERAAVAVDPATVRPIYPTVEATGVDAPQPPAPSTTAPRNDDVQYWRHSAGHSVRYFALVGRRDLLLDQDTWVPYDHYKSGPSWWRLTGETDADIIDASELPPHSPRPPVA